MINSGRPDCGFKILVLLLSFAVTMAALTTIDKLSQSRNTIYHAEIVEIEYMLVDDYKELCLNLKVTVDAGLDKNGNPYMQYEYHWKCSRFYTLHGFDEFEVGDMILIKRKDLA